MTSTALVNTFGASFVGLVVSAVLYGVSLLQTYIYFNRFPRDSWRLKLLVVAVWFLDTLHLFLCATEIYWYLVLNFFNPPALGTTHWSLDLQGDCEGFIGLAVQMFFAQRVWKVSKNWYLTGFIVVLGLLHFALGIFFSVEAFLLKDFSKFPQLTWATITGLGGAAVADLAIAGTLVYYLNKSRTGFKRTDSIINTLMIYSINTGLVTSICALLNVIFAIITPTEQIYTAFFWCLAKLYVNSFLATLNSRQSSSGTLSPPDSAALHLSSNMSGSSGPGGSLPRLVDTSKDKHSAFYSTSSHSQVNDEEKSAFAV